MTMNTPHFIYPPRASNAMSREAVTKLQREPWVAQIKLNDCRTCFSVREGTVDCFNRHGELRANNGLPPYLAQEIGQVCDKLDCGPWSYLDGGTLTGKSRHLTGLIALWDILVASNTSLVGATYRSRYERLCASEEHFLWTIGGKSFDLGLRLSEHIFVPHNYTKFDEVWDLVGEINLAAGWSGAGEAPVEGLVCKNMNGLLTLGIRQVNNEAWQAKSRIKTKRSRF